MISVYENLYVKVMFSKADTSLYSIDNYIPLYFSGIADIHLHRKSFNFLNTWTQLNM